MGRIAFMTSLILLFWSECATAVVGILDTEYLKKGVVRITAAPAGENQKVGTGFIVQLESDVVYIVTAAHVISGDAHPKVQFFTQQDVQVQATVKHAESSEDANGLALLMIRGKEAIPAGLVMMTLANTSHLLGADPILVVGHPRSAGDWAILSGSVVVRQGRHIAIDANIDEGTSGAPIFLGGEVVGLVGEVRRYARGATSSSIREYLEGHGILKQQALSSNPSAVAVPNVPSQENKSEIVREIVGKEGAPMMLIPAGEFWMGITAEELNGVVGKCNVSRHFDKQVDCKEVFLDEMPRHRVSVGSFLLDKYEVTNEHFEKFTRQTGYQTTAERKGNALTFVLGIGWKEIEGASWLKPEGRESVFETRRNQHPVVAVSWEDACAYCRWAGKRLPREAEWEYAARAGTVTQYWWGDRASGPYDVANLLDDDEEPVRATRGLKIIQWRDNYRQTSPVGAFRQNPWGLYDMIGNVWEWVDDWYDASSYSTEKPRKPDGLLRDKERVLRGGSWDNEPFIARVTTRGRESEDMRSPAIGFRCAQDAVNPAMSEVPAGKDVPNVAKTLRSAPAYHCNAKPIAPLKRKPEVFVSQWRAAIESMKAERNIHDLQNLFEIWGRIPVGLTGEQLVAEARYTVDCLTASGHVETESSTKPGQYWGVQFDNISMKFKK